jgi:chloramphenicol 3-O phosphotransferase
MKPGNIICLNGTSSAGKTTIAKALQRIMDEPYLHTGNDQFLSPHRPDDMLVYSDGAGITRTEGWLAVFQEDRLVDLEVGPVALRWLTGMYCAMAAWSQAGNYLIADVVLHERRILKAAADALHRLPVWLISVYCPLEVAEQREQEREERRALGGARFFFDRVYGNGVHDLMVDTASSSPEECALQIKQHLQTGNLPKAFRQLHRQYTAK